MWTRCGRIRCRVDVAGRHQRLSGVGSVTADPLNGGGAGHRRAVGACPSTEVIDEHTAAREAVGAGDDGTPAPDTSNRDVSVLTTRGPPGHRRRPAAVRGVRGLDGGHRLPVHRPGRPRRCRRGSPCPTSDGAAYNDRREAVTARRPDRTSAVPESRYSAVVMVVALDVERRPHVTGSTTVPTRQADPIPRHTCAGRVEPGRAFSAAITAATGMGQGAIAPEPSPIA
jgi:hypothetical protein